MERKKSSFSGLIKAATILALPVLLLFWYNQSSFEISIGNIILKKISWQDLPAGDLALPDSGITGIHPEEPILLTESVSDSLETSPDSLPVPKDSLKNKAWVQPDSGKFRSAPDTSEQKPAAESLAMKSDSGSQRILLIGDSQAGGIMYAFNDYCVENGHNLVGVFSWFSATCFNFGYSNRMENLIQTFRPSLVVIVLGLNELYARDIKSRQKAARMIQAKLGNIPYLWIGPANFMKDYGINRVFEEAAGTENFFLSRDLELPRAKDKRHPNQTGYKIWMDSIATFVQESKQYSFPFKRPKKTGSRIKARVITANAAKNREY
jgi:hypothetical protein